MGILETKDQVILEPILSGIILASKWAFEGVFFEFLGKNFR